jgi:ring-1,2-phenylacetyl-CoA epoxidase subunit PaaC
MAQDEMGHALVWYGLLESLGEPDPDSLAFLRDAPDWRNARLLELPRRDYAFSLMRRYLFDLSEAVRYDALSRSGYQPVAHAAAKLRQEEKYHLIHGRSYIERLGHAGGDSRARLQHALEFSFPYALGLWEPPEGEPLLVEAGIVEATRELSATWLDAAIPFLHASGLEPAVQSDGHGWRALVEPVSGGRRGHHGTELTDLLKAMQTLYRSDPQAKW